MPERSKCGERLERRAPHTRRKWTPRGAQPVEHRSGERRVRERLGARLSLRPRARHRPLRARPSALLALACLAVEALASGCRWRDAAQRAPEVETREAEVPVLHLEELAAAPLEIFNGPSEVPPAGEPGPAPLQPPLCVVLGSRVDAAVRRAGERHAARAVRRLQRGARAFDVAVDTAASLERDVAAPPGGGDPPAQSALWDAVVATGDGRFGAVGAVPSGASAVGAAAAVHGLGGGMVVSGGAYGLAQALALAPAASRADCCGATPSAMVGAWSALLQPAGQRAAASAVDAGSAAGVEVAGEPQQLVVVVRGTDAALVAAGFSVSGADGWPGQVGALAIAGAALSLGEGLSVVALGPRRGAPASFAASLRQRAAGRRAAGYSGLLDEALASPRGQQMTALAIVGPRGQAWRRGASGFVAARRGQLPVDPAPEPPRAARDAGAPAAASAAPDAAAAAARDAGPAGSNP